MKKILLLFSLCFAFALSANAQTKIYLSYKDGTYEFIYLSDIDSINFVLPNDYLWYSCPDSHHPHAIDLGLYSGTKWACCNVGAEDPAEYGSYFAWGEVEEKASYTSDTYASMPDIPQEISGTSYDAARKLLGGNWQMPNQTQFYELLNDENLSWTLKILPFSNGETLIGYSVESNVNGARIFLPFSGYVEGEKLKGVGTDGNYWSGSINGKISGMTYAIFLNLNKEWSYPLTWDERYFGRTIRPVCQ